MIIGIFLRNIKTYSGINYVPLSNGERFCGLVGHNGIGKSSVLESLDCLFNDRAWNYNVITKKSGFVTTRPYIVPIFFVKKTSISETEIDIAEKLSNFIWDISENDILPQNRNHYKLFEKQREILKRDFKKEDYLILPLGKTYDKIVSLGIFNYKKLGEIFVENFDKSNNQVADENLSIFSNLYEEIYNLYEYIYIPKDIDPEVFAQLETKEIQSLMGESLNQILEKLVPQKTIQEINTNLNGFISQLTDVLNEYSFRTLTDRQQSLRKNDVYKLIVEAYFKTRKLHKFKSEHWLEVKVLSSGEKQKALIEIAKHFLTNYRSNSQNLILAFDEPESSLHMSACYDQFDTLSQISETCCQLLITTHWYGFIPTVDRGNVSIISLKENSHNFDLISIASYREEIKQTVIQSKGKLPYDIRLKSLNDFIQSITTSILSETPYNWLICEGSSEKLYFEKYFKNVKDDKKLRIIPVGGANEIKKIYNYLAVVYEDFKNEIKGKVVLISDTDRDLVSYNTNFISKNLICKRIVNDTKTKKTILVNIQSNPTSPKTEIEDSLNGKLFYETLQCFKEDNPELDLILSSINSPLESEVYYSFDLPGTKQEALETFFDKGNIKYEFAKKYCELMSDDYKVPDWIEEVKSFFQSV